MGLTSVGADPGAPLREAVELVSPPRPAAGDGALSGRSGDIVAARSRESQQRFGWPTIEVRPTVVEDLGGERFAIFDLDAPRVDTGATRAAVDAQTADDALILPEDRARFTVRLTADQPVSVGEPLTLAINPERLYFFDPDSGAAL